MAENISKIYPKGLWGNDTLEKRYEHVVHVLKMYVEEKDIFDEHDLKWFLKNAIVNNIYISEDVFKLGRRAWKFDKEGNMQKMYETLREKGYLNYQCMNIRKYCNGKLVRFEHVLPSKIYMTTIKEKYENGQLTTFEAFENIRKKANVCIVTIEEDKRLNKYRAIMPNGDDWMSKKDGEFARYDMLKEPIEIYKRKK